MPADSKSKRYSPDEFVFVLRVAPVALLVIATSAPESTACDLSTIVPCNDALAVACACASRATISRPARAIPNVNATAVNCFLILTSTLQVFPQWDTGLRTIAAGDRASPLHGIAGRLPSHQFSIPITGNRPICPL